jgi:pimeloyl-ACP methyl ester carboxylesterase
MEYHPPRATAGRRVLFLPGASGDGGFWRPVAERLGYPGEVVLLDWPGLGDVPPRPDVTGFEDLVRLTLAHVDRPVDLVAQSMGGVVAVRVALERPDAVRRLVLTATSGGVDTARFSAADWRAEYAREYPRAAGWIRELRVDLTARIPSIRAPALLVWSDADPVSPLALGEHLARLLPRAELVVVRGAGHMFARDRAAEVAAHVARHLLDGRAP